MSRKSPFWVPLIVVLAAVAGYELGRRIPEATGPGGQGSVADLERRIEEERAAMERIRAENDAKDLEIEALEAEIIALRDRKKAAEEGTAAIDVSDEAPPTDEEREKAKAALPDLLYRLSADPTNPSLLTEYVRTAARAGEHDAAIAKIRELLEEYPDNPDLYTSLGHAYLTKVRVTPNQMAKGQLAFGAIDQFSTAIEKDETHFNSRWLRAIVQYNMPPFVKKLDASIKDLETMVEQSGGTGGDDRYAKVYALLGRAYEKAGRSEDAKKTLDRGLELFPGNESIRSAAGIK